MGEVEKGVEPVRFLCPCRFQGRESRKIVVVQAWPLPAFFFPFPTADFEVVGEEHLFLLEKRILLRFHI